MCVVKRENTLIARATKKGLQMSLRAKLYSNEKEALEVDETDDEIVVRIGSIREIFHLIRSAFRIKRWFGSDDEEDEDEGKPVRLQWGWLKLRIR